MGWNGSGVVSLTDGVYTSTWAQNWRDNGAATIKVSEFDALLQDVEDSIQNCLPHNGEKAATANIPMGGFRLTNITASGNSDAGKHGDIIASGAYSVGDDEIQLTKNDGTRIDIDTSSLSAGTGGVDLTTAQTVAGIKTFSAIGSHAHVKFNGPSTHKISAITSSSTPTCNTTTTDVHFLNVNQNMTLDFTWPTGASDTQLGTHWGVKGYILLRWAAAGYTITLDSTMLSALNDYEIESTHTTGSGEMSSLVYAYQYLDGTEYAQFAWVSTP